MKVETQDVETTRRELLATLEHSIAEVSDATLARYVVVLHDGTPLRTDGKRIALYGATIYSTANRIEAVRISGNFNRKFKEKNAEARTHYDTSAEWRITRAATLRKLIQEINQPTSERA